MLAGLSTPLVLSVHTIISFDFAVANLPGWHATIFPPYFVAGAVYSGFAMVINLAVPIRHFYGMKDFITDKHLDNMAKVMLATGLMVFYGYGVEAFMAYYSANEFERDLMMKNRVFGPYGYFYFALIFCNGLVPQILWFQKIRSSEAALFIISLIVNVGMWLERFVILMSLQRDFLPSSWGQYSPTFWDISTYIGTFGLFLSLLFLFCRVLPMISIAEMKHLLPESHVHSHKDSHDHSDSAHGGSH
jgi:molybdopterin-containing oxidoreductase family membrane subunit